jgi:tetratricopeptide (TPR) repeat protein
MEVINNSLKRWQEKDLPHQDVLNEELLTWKGRILDRQGDTLQAAESFKKAFKAGEKLPNTCHRSFYVASGYHAGKLLYEKDDYPEARRYLEKVKDCKTGDRYKEQAGQLLQSMQTNN